LDRLCITASLPDLSVFSGVVKALKLRESDGFFFEVGVPGPLPVSVKLEQGFFCKTNSANQSQDSKQSKISSMFQPGLSQSLAWQWVCADWVQPRLCEALWRSKPG
jgi:hypothetical protein